MTAVGTVQGNLVINELHHIDYQKYSYTIRYYSCHCNLCGRDVVIPATNLKKYVDCGHHWKEKITIHIPYKGGFITRKQITKITGMQYTYVSVLLNRGNTAEQIISGTYPKQKRGRKSKK